MKFIAAATLSALFLLSPAVADVKRAAVSSCDDKGAAALLVAGPITSYSVLPILEYLTKAQSPILVFNSPGGEMEASIMIADAVRARGGVRCYVKGLAASGAFAILQSCSFRAMTKDSRLGTHEPKMLINIPFDRFESANVTQKLEASTRAWNDRCRAKMRITQTEYDAKVREQNWTMDSSEALKLNAVDVVLPN